MKKILVQALMATLVVVLFSSAGSAVELAGPQVQIDISNHPFKGPAAAPVTVVVFSDYL